MPDSPGFEAWKSSSSDHFAQILELEYVALPSGPLPSLFKWRSQIQNSTALGGPGVQA